MQYNPEIHIPYALYIRLPKIYFVSGLLMILNIQWITAIIGVSYIALATYIKIKREEYSD